MKQVYMTCVEGINPPELLVADRSDEGPDFTHFCSWGEGHWFTWPEEAGQHVVLDQDVAVPVRRVSGLPVLELARCATPGTVLLFSEASQRLGEDASEAFLAAVAGGILVPVYASVDRPGEWSDSPLAGHDPSRIVVGFRRTEA